MAEFFRINGTDILPLIEAGGIGWSRNDIDSPNAGRTLDATMNRGRVAQKVKLKIKCRPLTQAEAEVLLNLIDPEYVIVDYKDPKAGVRTGVQFYSNNVPATLGIIDTDGVLHWKDISFPLVER